MVHNCFSKHVDPAIKLYLLLILLVNTTFRFLPREARRALGGGQCRSSARSPSSSCRTCRGLLPFSIWWSSTLIIGRCKTFLGGLLSSPVELWRPKRWVLSRSLWQQLHGRLFYQLPESSIRLFIRHFEVPVGAPGLFEALKDVCFFGAYLSWPSCSCLRFFNKES